MDQLVNWILIIIIAILLIHMICHHKAPEKHKHLMNHFYEAKEQAATKAESIFNNIRGHNRNDAKDALEALESIPEEKKDYQIHQRMAQIHGYMMDNPEKAKHHLEKAIENMKESHEYIPQILDQYEDTVLRPHVGEGVAPVRELARANPQLHHILDDITELHRALEWNEAMDAKGTEYLEQKIHWRQDGQNVHDRQVNDDVINTYRKILTENNNEYTGTYSTPETAYTQFRAYAIGKDPSLRQVFREIDQDTNYAHFGQGEKQIFGNMWLRINSEQNKGRHKNIKEAMIDALRNCKQGQFAVCSTGRVTNAIQAFTGVDADPQMGRIMSKEALRNEAFAKCAKIMRDNPNDNEDTLGQQMEAALRKDYSNLVKKDELDKLIDECKLAL